MNTSSTSTFQALGALAPAPPAGQPGAATAALGVRGFLVGGTASGAGKTTLTLALIAALVARGHSVQPFKVGPDPIDLSLHSAVAGRQGYSLDAFLGGQEGCCQTFYRPFVAAAGQHMSLAGAQSPQPGSQPIQPAPCTMAVVEGVMGLFDGVAFGGEEGSPAQIAKWLGLPVVLVLDARSLARSVAALAQGFVHFDPQLSFAGVVCNRVGSPRHAAILCQALQDHCPQVRLLGCMPRLEDIRLPARYLGLVAEEATANPHGFASTLRQWAEDHLDMDALVAALPDVALPAPEQAHLTLPSCQSEASVGNMVASTAATPVPHAGARNSSKVRVAVAHDAAFSFYFQENRDRLEAAGAELCFFSPLHDAALPAGVQGLWLGGGYPELVAEGLAANQPMLRAVRQFAQAGGTVWAEGGGFMYLMQGVTTASGQEYAMAGVFPFACRMHAKRQALGYRLLNVQQPCCLAPAPTVLRGHEFRYSALVGEPLPHSVTCVGTLADASGNATGGMAYSPAGLPATLGLYAHLYLGSFPASAAAFLTPAL
ncbi:cobyrinate a,c-diamide synthase [Desulfovibrio cuneatus]|uniref:cobyrinate a,c-diamide synthase n=1 Tax=Desulfovibrio cuneatus TaxID=159728 RepID=UPI0003FBB31B|nr:cobyrinate a,c-diamide synthase [Desulfovibrio cuneatus]